MADKRTKDTITIGSGIPYIMEYTGTLPDHEAICVEENRLGYTKGGAALEYTVEPAEEKDDLGYVSKVIYTNEEAVLKLGLLTWNGEVLQKLADRCQVQTSGGLRRILLGGAGNAQGKDWVVCFHHIDKKDGDLWVIIRGSNTAGIALTFAADEGTVVEPEFRALPQDENGTLVQILEQTSAT